MFPDAYWNDKADQITIQKPNLNYYTKVVTNIENVNPEALINDNNATLRITPEAVLDAIDRTNGIINLPNDIYEVSTEFNRNGKNYETTLSIDVSTLDPEAPAEVPQLNPATTNIVANGVYEVADTDNNPEDMEITQVSNNRSLNITKIDSSEKAEEAGSLIKEKVRGVNIGRFTVDVPQPKIQNSKTVTIDHNYDSIPYSLIPDGDNEAIRQANIIVNVPQNANIQDSKTVSIDQNYDIVPYSVNPDSGYDAFRHLNVFVDVPEVKLDEIVERTITSNGNYIIRPTPATPQNPEASQGIKGADIRVNVELNNNLYYDFNPIFTSNGTHDITPPAGYDGFGSVAVTVNVPPLTVSQISFHGNVFNIDETEWTRVGNGADIMTTKDKQCICAFTYDMLDTWTFEFYYAKVRNTTNPAYHVGKEDKLTVYKVFDCDENTTAYPSKVYLRDQNAIPLLNYDIEQIYNPTTSYKIVNTSSICRAIKVPFERQH